jgi:translation elongation factor P/translation initiation factor 5A
MFILKDGKLVPIEQEFKKIVDINKKISSKGGTKRRKRVKNINKSE